MIYAQIIAGEAVQISGAFRVGDVVYPAATLGQWTAAELEAIGVYGVEEPALAPGFREASRALVVIAGRPTWQVAYEAIPLDELKAQRLEEIAYRRWQAEIGGFTGPDDVQYPSDELAQAKVNGAVTLLDKDPTLTEVDWELGRNNWITMPAAQVQAMGVLIGRHIQACFTHSRGLMAQVQAAADVAELLAVDIETGWPG